MSRLLPDSRFCLHFKIKKKIKNRVRKCLTISKIFWEQEKKKSFECRYCTHGRFWTPYNRKRIFTRWLTNRLGPPQKKWPLHHDTQKRLHYPPWKHSTVTNTHTHMYFHNIKLSFNASHSHSIFSFILDHTFHHLLMYMNVLYQARWWQQ